jgi:hypothetical protein
MITYKVHPEKFLTSFTLKMILSSTLKNYNIQAFIKENIHTKKMITSSTSKMITAKIKPSPALKLITFTPG